MKRCALLMVILMLLLLPGLAGAAEIRYESDFSASTDGWYGRGCSVRVTEDGLLTSFRKATWHSPGRAFALLPGAEYTISVEVLQKKLPTGRFTLSCEYTRNGEASWENIASADVPLNQWTTISATWTAGDADAWVLYVEGGEPTTSFTIRRFTLTGRGAPVPGEEEEAGPFTLPQTPEALSAFFDALPLAPSAKKDGENNPLFTQRFGADPGCLVHNGRLYVYTTNDVVEYAADGSVKENTYGQIRHINCISSTDLVNWTDHGAIPVAGRGGVASWAGNSWAPCAAHKVIDGQDKFFLYFCNGGNGVAVLTADDPAGPWADPLGHGLITRKTPGCADVPWLFDPAVFVDHDGTGYLYFGGGVPAGMDASPRTLRCVQLGEDMISLAGDPQVIDAPYAFEDSGMNRIGDTYYHSYCSNWNTSGNSLGLTSGAIQYMTAPGPMGPFTYGGELFVNQGRFFGLYGNNHHSIVAFGGQHYLLYHSRAVEKAQKLTGNYRSPQMDLLPVGTDGRLGPVKGTMKGVQQLHTLNPWQRTSACTMYRQGGLKVAGYGPDAHLSATTGDFLQLRGVDMARGAAAFTLSCASETGGAVRLMSGSGTVLCDIPLPAGTDGEITVPVAHQEGVTDLYFIFAGQVTARWWQMTPAE